jgi:hypothetical protein
MPCISSVELFAFVWRTVVLPHGSRRGGSLSLPAVADEGTQQTDTLGFSQTLIGSLSALSAVGGAAGAKLFEAYIAVLPLRQQLTRSIAIGAASTLSYLLIVHPSPHAWLISAVLDTAYGACSTIAFLAILSLAATACPAEAEGFTFACLMAVYNMSSQASPRPLLYPLRRSRSLRRRSGVDHRWLVPAGARVQLAGADGVALISGNAVVSSVHARAGSAGDRDRKRHENGVEKRNRLRCTHQG